MTQNAVPKKKREVEANSGLKRYSLVLPEPSFIEVQRIAENEHTTILDLIRRFIKIGLLLARLSPDAEIIIREDDKETKLLFLTSQKKAEPSHSAP
jgi:hypothetical protein